MISVATTAPARAATFEKRFEAPMFVAALLVIPVVILDASDVSQNWKLVASSLNWLVWAAFAIELVTMVAVSDDRFGWVRRHPLEVAIVVLTPPLLPASLQALRLFRLLRLLRVVVIVKEARRLLTVDGVRLAAVIAAVAALGGGAIFAAVEPGDRSVWDGTWWAVTTMATVGYGDLSPTTVVGRCLAIGLMLIGVGFFALVTGAVAERFVAGDVRQVEEAEAELAGDVAATREEIVAELRAITSRLQQLEQRMEEL